ncbi:MAG: hypothetical protein U0R80_00280 [Nocardioidaceae bacterium]
MDGNGACPSRWKKEPASIKIIINVVTTNSNSNARDRYTLNITSGGRHRSEKFTFKRRGSPGRRITINGATINIGTETGQQDRNLQLADEQTTVSIPRSWQQIQMAKV